MGRKHLLVVLLTLLSRIYAHPSIGSDDTYTVTGFFGCRFSPVCTGSEVCINDGLFGNCQEPGRLAGIDDHQYELTPDYLQLIIEQVQKLVEEGYTWENLYTQCVIGNLLLAYRVGQTPDLNFCDPKDVPQKLDPNFLNLLQKLIDDYPDVDETIQEEKRENENDNKEAETDFVNVHKYLKERKSSLPEEEVQDYLSDLSMKELLELKEYLGDMRRLLESQEAAKDEDLDVENWPELEGTSDLEKKEEEQFPDWSPAAIVEEHDKEIPDSAELGTVIDKKNDYSDDRMFLSPDEAKMIFDLIDGKQLPDDLSEEQIRRLTEEVSDILQKVRNEQQEAAEQALIEQSAVTAEDMFGSRSQTENENEGETAGESESDEADQGEAEAEDSEASDLAEKRADDGDKSVNDIQVDKYVAQPGPGYNILSNEVEEQKEPEPTVAPTDTLEPNVVTDAESIFVDSRYVFVEANRSFHNEEEALRLLGNLQYKLRLPPGSFSDAKIHDDTIVFRVNGNGKHLNASDVAKLAQDKQIAGNLMSDIQIVSAGTRNWADLRVANSPKSRYLVLAFVVCGCVAGTVLAILAIYLVRRHSQSRQKLSQLGAPDTVEASKDYQDLCRQRMQSKASEKPEPLHAGGRVSSVASDAAQNSPSSRSSTSSWSEEPVTSNMDITTGHIILSYMEDHLKNKDRLDQEWEELSGYMPDLNKNDDANNSQNSRKNRYSDILPYDHSRVVLNSVSNVLGSDYVNASTITDHDPRNPAYIATQGPLPHTVADFWQMIWEQGSVVIVMLTKLTENGNTMCHRYWPEEGSDLYHIYEVHLVSEHIWCDDYLVRSFYLKNLQTNETRTVTQFHFLTWPDLGVPSSAKALLDFRRKVNKSYKGRSCPIVVHCNDGVGRTGTYCLLDMVLSRMSKGAKEIDIAATLEHIRDQRMSMVKTKEQFEFALTAVAEEVHAILKALPQ